MYTYNHDLNDHVISQFVKENKDKSSFEKWQYMNLSGLHLLFESSNYGYLLRQLSYKDNAIDCITGEIDIIMQYLNIEENNDGIYSMNDIIRELTDNPIKCKLAKIWMNQLPLAE